jgi:hypothetical protein
MAAFAILQWRRLPAGQDHRLEAGATKAAARRIPVIPGTTPIFGWTRGLCIMSSIVRAASKSIKLSPFTEQCR